MSFEYYYITIVSTIILVIAIVIAVIMNEKYRKAISKYLTQASEAKGEGQVLSGDLEVLVCPRCGYSTTIPFRVGDYVGKVVNETCPKDGEKLVVHAIYSTGTTST